LASLCRRLSFNPDSAIGYGRKSVPNAIAVLGFNDILAAEQDMGVKFAKLDILPLFAKSDNNFVVFDFHKNVWMFFNIVDETKFRIGKTLVKLLK
jgi:hypothetical protein